MLSKIGLVVNPVSGTDVRRATSTAGFIDIMQKVRIVKSVLRGIEAVGADEILIMPDFYGIVAHALNDLPGFSIKWSFMDIKPRGDYTDTVESVGMMVKEKVGAIVLLGGDGTVRVASKASKDTPLMPISTGTNNVIPYMIDGTLAGIAAAAIANGIVNIDQATYRLNRLILIINGEAVDYALVDLGATLYPFRGARALLDPKMITEVFISLTKPTSIGLASIGSVLKPMGIPKDRVLHIVMGNKLWVKSVLMPGYITMVGIDRYEEIKLGTRIPIEKALTIELDGEREVEIYDNDEVIVTSDSEGPLIIDINETLYKLFLNGWFISS